MSSSELSTSDLDDELLEMVALEDGFVLPEGDCSPSADGAVAYPASPSASIASSIADVTDGSSDAGESIDATPIKKLSSDGKINNRTAKKNRARLHRYYRSKSELAELRVQVLELQNLLDRLKAEGDGPIASSTWLSTSPSPFTDDKIDEINPKARAPPKSKTTCVSRADGWKDAALIEHLRHRRAVTVRRKLKRMIKEYGQGTEAFMEWWAALQVRLSECQIAVVSCQSCLTSMLFSKCGLFQLFKATSRSSPSRGSLASIRWMPLFTTARSSCASCTTWLATPLKSRQLRPCRWLTTEDRSPTLSFWAHPLSAGGNWASCFQETTRSILSTSISMLWRLNQQILWL